MHCEKDTLNLRLEGSTGHTKKVPGYGFFKSPDLLFPTDRNGSLLWAICGFKSLQWYWYSGSASAGSSGRRIFFTCSYFSIYSIPGLHQLQLAYYKGSWSFCQMAGVGGNWCQGHNRQIKLFPAITLYMSSSFLLRTIKDWNCLPKEVEATRLATFFCQGPPPYKSSQLSLPTPIPSELTVNIPMEL